MSTITWTLGTEPDPRDRRHIRTTGVDTAAMESLRIGDRINVIDRITGDVLTLERISCGLGCMCAVGIVPAEELESYGIVRDLEPIGPATPCDECGHRGDAHTNLHEIASPVWSTATCWSELVCSECPPSAAGRRIRKRSSETDREYLVRGLFELHGIEITGPETQDELLHLFPDYVCFAAHECDRHPVSS